MCSPYFPHVDRPALGPIPSSRLGARGPLFSRLGAQARKVIIGFLALDLRPPTVPY
jgi:hypothetical protein